MPWPTGQDYNEAIQSPSSAFSDSELRLASVESTPLGLPRPRSGAFATVYRLYDSHNSWAVKCFNREQKDNQERYAAISSCLNSAHLPYMVDFDFLKQGIRLRGTWYPIVKMEWVHGEPLNVYLERNLKNRSALIQLATNWVAMTQSLRSAGIAHGDLQHGNVLVIGSQLKLVDYDGMYVPSLAGRISNETGQPNFQLPQRTAGDFGPYLDNFSEWVILVSILALIAEPQLWQNFRGGDDCLLFRKRDFEAPDQSTLFKQLERSPDQQIAAVANLFRSFLYLPPSSVPAIDNSLFSGISVSTANVSPNSGADWIADHLERQPSSKEKLERKAPQIGVDWIHDFTSPPPVAMQLSTNVGKERWILFISVLAIAAICAVTPLLIAALSCAAILVADIVLTLRSYSQLPELAGAQALRQRGRELQLELDNIAEQTLKHDKVRQQVRKDESEALKELNISKTAAASNDQRTQKQVRSKFDAILAPLNAVKLRLDAEENHELAQLQKTIGSTIVTLRTQVAGSVNAESGEIGTALKRIQDAFIQSALVRSRVLDASIPGVGNGFKKKLFQSGFQTAADVSYYSVQRVQGIGHSRASAIAGWRTSIEALAKSRMPKALSAAEEQTIRQRHANARAQLQQDLRNNENIFATRESEIRQRYTTRKISSQDAITTVQHNLQTALTNCMNEFRAKLAEFAETELKVKETADQQIKEVERQLDDLIRKRSQLQWKKGKLARELVRYANVTPVRYLRTIVLGR